MRSKKRRQSMRFFIRRDRAAIREWLLESVDGSVKEFLDALGVLIVILFWVLWAFLNFLYFYKIVEPDNEPEAKLEKPTTEMFVKKNVMISDLVGCDRRELYTVDLDEDGDVDALHFHRVFDFVDEEFMGEYGHDGGWSGSLGIGTRTMTPKLKETLTRITWDMQEVRVMIAEISYEAEQDWLKNKNREEVQTALKERSRKNFLYIQVILLLGCLIILFFIAKHLWREGKNKTRKSRIRWAVFLILFEIWSLVILCDTVATILWLFS